MIFCWLLWQPNINAAKFKKCEEHRKIIYYKQKNYYVIHVKNGKIMVIESMFYCKKPQNKVIF